MFDKYNLNVSKIFKKAEDEMLALKHPYVGTEHLMLVLLKMPKIKNICAEFSLTYDLFLQELKNIMGNAKKQNTTVLYTPLLKRVITTALDEASSEKEELDEIYLLRAIIDEGEGIAIRIMYSLGINLEELYKKLITKKRIKNQKKLEILEVGKPFKDLIDLSDKVVGREKEIELLIETLIRKNKNNPLLIGEAGVGKTAIVEELERRIRKGNVPDILKDYEIISLELGALVAGTKYRGEFEEKLTKIIKELEENPKYIVFIDEIHSIVNAGGAEGAINASDILKPYLARGKIKVIGATTSEEYRQTILKDKALMRRFEVIKVLEPDKFATMDILNKVKSNYEKHYQIKITKNNIKDIVDYSIRYLHDRHNPDKALDILDSVCAMVNVKNNYFQDIYMLNQKINTEIEKKEQYVKENKFEEASISETKIIKWQKKLTSKKTSKKRISKEDIEKLLSKKCNIPLLVEKEKIVNKLNKEIYQKVLGQDEALKRIIEEFANHINNEKRPLSVLLTGKTGVGKTLTIKSLASILKMNLIRLDMSEYNLDIAVNRLIGASAGYVGYNDEAIFNKVKMYPYSIILVDEVEKASPAVLNLFLQILDEGFITNNRGELIDFKNTFIFMTSNVTGHKKIGFNECSNEYTESFSPEFLARLDAVINFKDIDKMTVIDYLKKNGIEDLSLIEKINYQKYGLREGKKVMEKYLLKIKS